MAIEENGVRLISDRSLGNFHDMGFYMAWKSWMQFDWPRYRCLMDLAEGYGCYCGSQQVSKWAGRKVVSIYMLRS